MERSAKVAILKNRAQSSVEGERHSDGFMETPSQSAFDLPVQFQDYGPMFIIWTILFSLLLPTLVTAAERGAMLEFPRGRFQESSVPDFFKWALLRTVDSVTLKIYRANDDEKFDPVADLLVRYDLVSGTQSISVPKELFPKGNYVWSIEGYDGGSGRPVFSDSAKFTVEPLRQVTLRSLRFGALVGFSRGTYKTSDPTYNISYDTTPTTYGLLLKGGSANSTWDVNVHMSDFVLRGNVQHNYTGWFAYSRLLNSEDPYRTQFFFGPTFRAFSFPRVRSTNGTDLYDDNVLIGNPGASLSLHKRFDANITVYSQVGLDIPVVGTEEVAVSLDQINYVGKVGFLFGLFWPLGFGGEFQYQLNKASTKDGADTITTEMGEWAIMANINYAL